MFPAKAPSSGGMMPAGTAALSEQPPELWGTYAFSH